jgi:hypothetical protein
MHAVYSTHKQVFGVYKYTAFKSIECKFKEKSHPAVKTQHTHLISTLIVGHHVAALHGNDPVRH